MFALDVYTQKALQIALIYVNGCYLPVLFSLKILKSKIIFLYKLNVY